MCGPMLSDFFAEQPLTFEQVKALTRGMLTVARVDGIHDNEMRMVREFYESCARAGDPRLEEIASGRLDIDQAKDLFASPELSKLFVKTMILLAFADGSYASAEDQLIRDWAGRLGLSEEEVDHLHDATREFLLGGLTHVQNLDALRQVSRKLQPS